MARTIKLHKLPEQPQVPGFREAQAGDVDQIHQLYQKYMKRFDFYPKLTREEVKHYLLPQPGALSVFVVEVRPLCIFRLLY